jgi:hypothetical protein
MQEWQAWRAEMAAVTDAREFTAWAVATWTCQRGPVALRRHGILCPGQQWQCHGGGQQQMGQFAFIHCESPVVMVRFHSLTTACKAR